MYFKLIFKNINKILILFILFITINKFSYENLYFKEFFLNYNDGFLRRAIDGHLLFLIVKYSKITAIIIIPIITFTALIIYFHQITKFIIKYKYTFFLLLSMPVLLGEIYHLSIFRKDIIIILLFFLNINIIIKLKNKTIKYFLHFIISVFSILYHEIFFLISLIPLFFLILFGRDKFIKSSILIISFLIFLLTIKYSGLKIDSKVIIDSWNIVDKNILVYIQNLDKILKVRITVFYKTQNFTWQNLIYYLIFLVINYYLFVGYLLKRSKLVEKNFLLLFSSFYFLTLVFLCAIAVDFSRWFFLINSIIIIIFPKLLSEDYFKTFNNFFRINHQNIKYLIENNFIIYAFPFLGMPFMGFWTLNDYIINTPIGIVYNYLHDFLN